MPTFAHPALLWGLLIAGVPVLIHLINMFRHRRVHWAAMEFLLISQQRNRTWILLKQLLLLFLRVTAVTAVVLMLAQPRLLTRWGQFLDARRVHHIVLIDDSYSMTEFSAGATAFDRAKAAAERIAAEASQLPRSHTYSLIRFSQAADEENGQPDLLGESVGAEFMQRLAEQLKDMPPSETAAGPLPALESIDRWLGSDSLEQRFVYLLTDFRALHWGRPDELVSTMQGLSRSRATLHLVQCVDRFQANAAITSLEVAAGIRAAGVPFFVDVTVTNHSDTPWSDVVVLLEADGSPRPAIRIPRIPARQSVTERTSMQFATTGEHLVTAELDSDAVQLDNRRQCVIDVPADLPVLLIDGDLEAADATYVSSALQPGGAVATGLTPRIEKPRYLSQNPLDSFRSIYLMNLERLEDSAIEALENYVTRGGGVGIFVGPRCSPSFFNEKLYRNGKGIFPVPLTGQEALLVDRLEKVPDLEVTDHPIFRIFSGGRSGFLSTVVVSRYIATVDPFPDSVDSSVEVIARLRTGAPLVLERQYGKGRVVAFLTTAGPSWNNWARGNPSYVVAMLELQAFLSQQKSGDLSQRVGSDLRASFEATTYRPQVRWLPPAGKGLESTTSDAILQDDGIFVAEYGSAPVSGIYRAEITSKEGADKTIHLAVNVEPQEGNLDLVDGPTLAAKLEGLDYRYEFVGTFRYAEKDAAGTDLTDTLLFMLLGLLLLEQILAYWVGDHPPQSGTKGGSP